MKKKAALTMGIKSLIYIIIAIIIIFGVSDVTRQLFKSIFGFSEVCESSFYFVDELPDVVDDLKIGLRNYDVRILFIEGDCSIVGFDKDKDFV